METLSFHDMFRAVTALRERAATLDTYDEPQREADRDLARKLKRMMAGNLTGRRVRVVSFRGKTDLDAIGDPADRETARLAIGHVGTVVEDRADGDLVRVEPSCYVGIAAWFPHAELEVLDDGDAVPGATAASNRRAAIVDAALANLELDLNGGDEAALTVVREHVGDDSLSFEHALGLLAGDD